MMKVGGVNPLNKGLGFRVRVWVFPKYESLYKESLFLPSSHLFEGSTRFIGFRPRSLRFACRNNSSLSRTS